MNDHAELAQKFIESFEVVAVNLEFFEDMKDKGLWETLIPNGYLQFGKGPDMDYDPVCFDISSRKNRDYRIVKIDHEEILCNYRSKVVCEIAPSFRALVLQTIERASAARKSRRKRDPNPIPKLTIRYLLHGFAGTGAGVAGAVDLLKSKFTLGAVRAPSSVLK